MKVILTATLLLLSSLCVVAQEASEKRFALSETAVALDGAGAAALEATLKTTVLNGADDSPVTNVSLVVKNASGVSYVYVSGLVTFYDGAGVRCGEGVFKADAVGAGEAFETDAPGIRIRCAPSTWRIVATNLIPKVGPLAPAAAGASRAKMNLVISVDGEEHPIQLDKPMVVNSMRRCR